MNYLEIYAGKPSGVVIPITDKSLLKPAGTNVFVDVVYQRFYPGQTVEFVNARTKEKYAVKHNPETKSWTGDLEVLTMYGEREIEREINAIFVVNHNGKNYGVTYENRVEIYTNDGESSRGIDIASHTFFTAPNSVTNTVFYMKHTGEIVTTYRCHNGSTKIVRKDAMVYTGTNNMAYAGKHRFVCVDHPNPYPVEITQISNWMAFGGNIALHRIFKSTTPNTSGTTFSVKRNFEGQFEVRYKGKLYIFGKDLNVVNAPETHELYFKKQKNYLELTNDPDEAHYRITTQDPDIRDVLKQKPIQTKNNKVMLPDELKPFKSLVQVSETQKK